jgi:hypothetical protein
MSWRIRPASSWSRPWRRSYRPQAARRRMPRPECCAGDPGAPPGERCARACQASTASTTLPPSACPGQPSVSAPDAAVADLATADLDPGTLHPDLARLPIRPMH